MKVAQWSAFIKKGKSHRSDSITLKHVVSILEKFIVPDIRASKASEFADDHIWNPMSMMLTRNSEMP
jgi:hypothetical protein